MRKSLAILLCILSACATNTSNNGLLFKFSNSYYDENKKVKKEEKFYINDILSSIVEYYENGNVKRKISFKNGSKIREQKCDENGKLQYEISYKDDRKNGLAKWYFENRNVEKELMYKDDKIVWQNEYDENGKLIKEQKYDKDGNLISEEEK